MQQPQWPARVPRARQAHACSSACCALRARRGTSALPRPSLASSRHAALACVSRLTCMQLKGQHCIASCHFTKTVSGTQQGTCTARLARWSSQAPHWHSETLKSTPDVVGHWLHQADPPRPQAAPAGTACAGLCASWLRLPARRMQSHSHTSAQLMATLLQPVA